MTKTSVTAFHFEPWSFVPNNPRLPALIYEGAFPSDVTDLAALMEKRFQENGWPPQWRNGIYDFEHYHSQGHVKRLAKLPPDRRPMLTPLSDEF